MEFDLGKAKVHFTVRELFILLTFIGGLASHVIRTEVQDANLQAEINRVQVKLMDCEKRLAENRRP